MTGMPERYNGTNLWIQYPTPAYHNEVKRYLQLMATTKSGKLLLSTIGGHRNFMVIYPYTPTKDDPVNAFATVSNQGVYADTLALGYVNMTEYTLPGGLVIKLPTAIGTGKGSTVIVSYHPATWLEKIKRKGGYMAPGEGPGEVLFHEMVHGMRQQNGLMRNDPVPGYTDMDDEEEFYAILAANVYRTERGFKALRKDHTGFAKLEEKLASSDAYYKEFKSLIDRWFTVQAGYCTEMAKIKTWFNPFTSAAIAKGLMARAP
jgi:hypothetical protein